MESAQVLFATSRAGEFIDGTERPRGCEAATEDGVAGGARCRCESEEGLAQAAAPRI